MAHDADKKREARKRYVFDRQAMPTVAIALTVSESTLRRWKREAEADGDDWDQARAANTVAGEGLEKLIMRVVEDYVAMHQATIEDLKAAIDMAAGDKAKALASLADSFNKTVSAAGRLSPKISELGVAMDVLKRMADFVGKHYPGEGAALLKIIEPFGQHLAEVYA